jgi:glycosyltransferase involved in cell wall biosynthesis
VAAKDVGINVPFDRLGCPELDASLLIDRYLTTHYSKEDIDNIIVIRDAGVGGFAKHNLSEICVFGNPYYTLYDELLRLGLVDRFTYYRCHDFRTYLERKTAESALRNVALSNFMAQVEMSSLGVLCDKVINNAVDVDLFKPKRKDELRAKYGVPADRTVACWVGSSHPTKGIETMLELSSRFRNIYWILVFKDLSWPVRIPDEMVPSSVARIVRNVSTKIYELQRRNVRVLRQIQPHELSEIYSLSDFAVLPYLCEGNSHVVLEACSCNLPLITTRTGLLWDFWDKRIGWPISKPRDIEEYSEAVKKMIHEVQTFEPRNVIIEQMLDLRTWGESWVTYLLQGARSG